MYAPRAVVLHDYHGDRGAVDRAHRRRYMCERNRLQNLIKNVQLGRLLRVLPRIVLYERSRLKWLRGAIRRGEDEAMHKQIAGIIRRAWAWNLVRLPGILLRRRRVQKLRRLPDRALASLIAEGVQEGSHVGDLAQILAI